jgi:hypothetical protein
LTEGAVVFTRPEFDLFVRSKNAIVHLFGLLELLQFDFLLIGQVDSLACYHFTYFLFLIIVLLDILNQPVVKFDLELGLRLGAIQVSDSLLLGIVDRYSILTILEHRRSLDCD